MIVGSERKIPSSRFLFKEVKEHSSGIDFELTNGTYVYKNITFELSDDKIVILGNNRFL